MRLKEKNAVITGSGSGIGRETALLFAREGARVVVADINEPGGTETVRAIQNAGGNAHFVRTDVSQQNDIKALIEFTEKELGHLDILFNNAGVFLPEDDSVTNTGIDIWDMVMDINLKGVYLGCKYGVPAMLRGGGGSIINTASFVAIMGAAAPQIAYTASKGGVLAMTREIAVEFAKKNIRVNAICPGPVETPLLKELLADPDRRQRRLIHLPMGRFAKPMEIAQGALFLASDDASYVTGSTFLVDGGLTAAYITPE